MKIQTKITGVHNLLNDLAIRTKAGKKALETAIKVEGFRRLRELRQEIRQGTPAGKQYAAQLSRIARRTKRGTPKKNQIPLYRLARLVRYNVDYSTGQLKFHFGFVNTNSKALSSTYKDLLRKHQEGVDVLYRGSRSELGRRFARIGGKLKKKGDPDFRFFFLRKTTGRRIRLPERQMINPFFKAYRAAMLANIRKNFRLKMAGKRI